MPKPTKKPAHPKKYKILPILIALLLAAPLLYLAYDAFADYQDKQRFETVRASIEALRGRLQAEAENGEQWTTSASCSQGSVKFQEATKVCDLRIFTQVDVDSEEEADTLIDRHESLLKNANDLFKARDNYSALPSEFPKDLNGGSAGAGYREKATDTTCGSYYTIEDNYENAQEAPMLLSFSCNSAARELHYPRDDT